MNWVHNTLVAVLIAMTPAGAAFRYEKPAPAPQIEVIPATSGAVPR